MLQGEDVLIDGFTSNKNIRIGPNFACNPPPPPGQMCPDNGERLRCVRIFNVSTTFANAGLEIHTGVLGCYFENVTTVQPVTVHLPPSGGAIRPTDRIHWKADTISPGVSVQNHAALCPDVGPCLGDVNEDGTTDVDDLLILLQNWGQCQPQWVNECYPCVADIVPYHCGDANVNTDDLLALLQDWDCTMTTVGHGSNAPQNIQDCWDEAAERYEPETPEFYWAYDMCIEALCRAGKISSEYCED